MAPQQHIEAVKLLDQPAPPFGGTDWVKLYQQKLTLLRIQKFTESQHEYDAIEGLLSFLDCLTDAAMDCGLLGEKDVKRVQRAFA
jgi:hypothetical protein